MRRFLTRSADREKAADLQRIDPIKQSVNDALQSLEAEKKGFESRVADATIRAAFIAGSDRDGESNREPADNALLKQYEDQIRHADARRKQLDDLIANLKFIRAAVMTRLA